jgi:hypothetical protein
MYIHYIDKPPRCTGKTCRKPLIVPKKKTKKDKQLVIRLEKDLRDEFVSICYEMDTSAAREIRRFIKRFIELNRSK